MNQPKEKWGKRNVKAQHLTPGNLQIPALGVPEEGWCDGWAPEHCETVASLHVTYIPPATPTFLNNSWEGQAPTHPLS